MPEDWLLTSSEVREAMGGNFDRTAELQMSTITKGNEVEPLITGELMFAQILEDVLATDSDDYVYYTAWAIQPNMTLDPRRTVAPDVDSSMSSLWTSAIRRGVTCLTLLWRNELNLEVRAHTQGRCLLNPRRDRPCAMILARLF
jgi:hypothetical protein